MTQQPTTQEVLERDVVVGAQVESWLEGQLRQQPDQPVLWLPGWSSGAAVTVRNVEHLAVLVSGLAVDRFGGVESHRGDVRRWGQTVRTGECWIVAVHDGTDQDFAQRVFRGEPGEYPQPPQGRRPLYAIEEWTSLGAAEVMWIWLRGALGRCQAG